MRYKHFLMHIYDKTFNMISFIEIANNTKTLKITDFTCKLGFGPSKSPKSTVADSLPNSWLVDFTDLTPAFEDVDSKSCWVCYCYWCWCWETCDDSDENLGLKFCHKAIFFRLWAQGLIRILKSKFMQDFEAGVWLVFCADV